jgi:hypothetical protein
VVREYDGPGHSFFSSIACITYRGRSRTCS